MPVREFLENMASRTRDALRREAERLLEAAGATHEPVSLRDVVSALNLSLVQAEREPFSREAALAPLGDGFAVSVRSNGGERRRRFSIAHEIGHFVLHPGQARYERGGAVNEAMRVREREANAFAAELLMPEHLVRQAVLEDGADARRLADRFEVSVAAMSLRLRRLGLAERQSELLPPSREVL
jgi:predicted transcriptional regulator